MLYVYCNVKTQCLQCVLTAQTSAINHHVCLKSAESVANTRNVYHQAVSHEPCQTYHNCHQGGPCCKFSPKGFIFPLYYKCSFVNHSCVIKQRPGKFVPAVESWHSPTFGLFPLFYYKALFSLYIFIATYIGDPVYYFS